MLFTSQADMDDFVFIAFLAVIATILGILLVFKILEFYIMRSLKAEKHQKKLQRMLEEKGQLHAPLPKRPSIFSNEVAQESIGSLSAYLSGSDTNISSPYLGISPSAPPLP